MFTSILNNMEGSLTIQNALLCAFVSLALGFVIALIYGLQGAGSKNFMVTCNASRTGTDGYYAGKWKSWYQCCGTWRL